MKNHYPPQRLQHAKYCPNRVNSVSLPIKATCLTHINIKLFFCEHKCKITPFYKSAKVHVHSISCIILSKFFIFKIFEKNSTQTQSCACFTLWCKITPCKITPFYKNAKKHAITEIRMLFV